MDKLIELNENLETPVYLTSHLESPKEKHEFFVKYQISKPQYHDIIILIIGYNKKQHKLNNFNTDSFKTSYSMKIQYHEKRSFHFFY